MTRRDNLSSDGSITEPPRPLGLIGMFCGSLWLTACGGGGDSAAPPPAPPPPPAATALPDLDIVAPATADLGAAVAISTSVTPAAVLKAQWDFGDGTTAVDSAPQHQFARAGDLTVKLTLTNEAGTQKSYTKPISLTNKVLVKGNYCSGANDQGWCWMPPQVSGNGIRDIKFIDVNNGWRSDEFGDVFNTTDGGKSWKRQTTGVRANLTQVLVHSLQDVVAVSPSSNLLVISVDGGKNWQKQVLPITSTANSTVVHALGQGRVLVRRHAWSEGSETAYYLDRATGSWQPVALGTHEQISVGADGSILTYSAKQVTHRASPLATPTPVFTLPALPASVSDDRIELSRTQDQVVWLMRVSGSGYGGAMRLYRSLDGGQQWDPNPITMDGGLSASSSKNPTVQASDASGTKLAIQTYMSGGIGGTAWDSVWYSGDSGSTWARKVRGSVYPYATAWCQPSDYSLLVCYSALNYVTASASVSRDYGLTRTPVPLALTGVPEAPRDLAGAALLVDSWLGIAVASADLTAKWHLFAALESPLGVYPGGKPTFPATVPSFGSRKVARRVLNGAVFATDDGGRSWTALGQLLSADGKDMLGLAEQKTATQAVTRLKSASMVDDRTALLVTSTGKVVMSGDAGATWTRPAALNQDGLAIEQLQFQDANLGWAIGKKDAAPRLLVTRDGGKTWRALDFVPTAAPLSVLVGADQQLTVAAKDGAVYRSTNDGGSWTSPGNVGSPLTQLFFSRDGGTYWATGSAGAVFKSTDKGLTWQKTQLATTANLLAVCFADGSNGWASGQAGQMWATRDGGTTWRAQSTPAAQDLTALNCQDSRTVWAAGSGGLLATGTGGE